MCSPETPLSSKTSMHGDGGIRRKLNARKKPSALIAAFCFAITWRCVSVYAPGILWDWHWGWTLYRVGWQRAVKVGGWA